MKNHLKLAITLFFTGTILNSLSAQESKDTTYTVYYKSNSYSIDSNQKKLLKLFLSQIMSVNKITGYADSVGSNDYNLRLSEKRADIISKLVQESYPKFQPKAFYKGEDFEQEPDLAKNRKVEIVASVPIPAAISSDNKIINSFNLDNIYFLPDRAIVTDESIPYINELASRLKTYKTEYFEIIGHVNYQSKKDSSQLQDLYWLSERRAKKIYDMLIEKGIPASRMTYKGVGNSQPIYPDPINEDEKRKNMRVEVIILKK